MEVKKTVFADSHVHIYDCYNLKDLFNYAYKNFNEIHNKLKLTENFIGVLFLTEAGEANYFQQLFENPGFFSETIKFKIEHTSEKNSLRVKTDSGNYLIIIAGQQVITAENLEVLALGTTQRFEYGKKIIDTIGKIKEHNAVPVIPWGAGKWIGKRGRIVSEIINNKAGVFLGDNSGRPFFWSAPEQFNAGLKNEAYTLRGSDPLNIKSCEKKTGSFGFYFVSHFDIEKPWESLKIYFSGLKSEPDNYGSLESAGDFVKNQLMLRLNKLSR